jgi:lipopolysaccharide heptosyltransferase I
MAKNILIVKTSSLGDIIQSFPVLEELKCYFPNCKIDWVVKEKYEKFLRSHPLINTTIAYDKKSLLRSIRELRKKKYDILVDLQGNTKSAFITFLAIAKVKLGFGRKSVREFPNLLVTNHKYNISKNQNIQTFYLELIRSYFKINRTFKKMALNMILTSNDRKNIPFLNKDSPKQYKIMVAMGSFWENKKVSNNLLVDFIHKIQKSLNTQIYLVFGSEQEKEMCEFFQTKIKESTILKKMEIQIWQYVMSKMDLILTVDSAALHLAATTNAITFSIFGPTSANVFQPLGQHFSYQGKCPYNVYFTKQCPHLRKCITGDCMKKINLDELWKSFQPCLKTLKSIKS